MIKVFTLTHDEVMNSTNFLPRISLIMNTPEILYNNDSIKYLPIDQTQEKKNESWKHDKIPNQILQHHFLKNDHHEDRYP